MKFGVNQQRQIHFEAQYTCEVRCKEIMEKMDQMVCDWLKSLWIQRKYFQRPPGHSTLFCMVALFVSEIWACTYTLPQTDGFTF